MKDIGNGSGHRPITTVVEERHALAQRALSLLGSYAGRVASGQRYDPRLADSFLDFLRAFTGRVQQELEDARLFPWLTQHGLPPDSGPLAVLQVEHELCNEQVKDLEAAARALMSSPGDRDLRIAFHGRAVRLAEHFLAHLDKEDRVILPLARRLAAPEGDETTVTSADPVREREWIEALEAHRTEHWPEAVLTRQGLGTTTAFERLCWASLDRPWRGAAGA
jgi:hemerythrin-like domain-containing protein